MADLKRWCVKAKDGWPFAVPNRKFADDATNVKAACGRWVILPYGCERRYTTCRECLDALKE
jgi:hypothetical protein